MFMQFENISRSALIGGIRSAGERVGFHERSPAASIGPAKAGYFIPFKAIGSRVNSDSAVTNAEYPVAAVHESRHAAAAGRSMQSVPRGMASRTASGAGLPPGSYASVGDRRNSPFAYAESAFPRGKLAQTVFDIIAVGFMAAFASLLGLAIMAAPLVLFFG